MKTLRIVSVVEEIRVVGPVLRTSWRDGRHTREIPTFFNKVLDEGSLETVPLRRNKNQLCVFRTAAGTPDFDYLVGVEVEPGDEVPMPAGMEQLVLPLGDYAVLTLTKRGPEDVGKAFERLREVWLPRAGYQAAGSPGFVCYEERFTSVFDKHGYSGVPCIDLYIPVVSR